MTVPTLNSLLSSEAAMLLVLLPVAVTAAEQQQRVATQLKLDALQQQLGSAIRVLCIDEGSHPVAVHSFDGIGLPAFVLLRHGVELWREQGLPVGEVTVALLVSKLHPTSLPAAWTGPE